MNNNSYIELKSIQMLDGEKDIIEVCVRGQVEKTDNGYVVNYTESADDGRETFTKLTFKEGEATLERSGAATYAMDFAEMQSTSMKLNTPYGMAELGIITECVKVSKNDNIIDLEIIYSLMQGGQLMADTNLEMRVKLD